MVLIIPSEIGSKKSYFEVIDSLLLKMYYLYKNSPKKCQDLQDVVRSFKDSFDESSTRPPRAHSLFYELED